VREEQGKMNNKTFCLIVANETTSCGSALRLCIIFWIE
jgi:hypothetical protein